MLEYTEYTKMLIGLIAILNPLGAVPIFISLTSELDVSERRTISNVVVNSVLIILLLSLFIGNWILIFFWYNNQFISCCRRITYSVDGYLHDACKNKRDQTHPGRSKREREKGFHRSCSFSHTLARRSRSYQHRYSLCK